MADPVLGTAYSVDGMIVSNDGNGGLCFHIYQHDYNSTGTGEPMLIREIKLTTAERADLITAISDTEE